MTGVAEFLRKHAPLNAIAARGSASTALLMGELLPSLVVHAQIDRNLYMMINKRTEQLLLHFVAAK